MSASSTGDKTRHGRARRGAADDSWTPKMDTIAQHVIQQARARAWSHSHMATAAKLWGDRMNIASGALGGVVGTTGLASVFGDGPPPLWARVVQLLLGFSVGLMSVLATTWRLSESQAENMQAHVNYETIIQDLGFLRSLPSQNKTNSNDYLKSKVRDFIALRQSSPLIEDAVRRLYATKFPGSPAISDEDLHVIFLATDRSPTHGAAPPDDLSDASTLSVESASDEDEEGGRRATHRRTKTRHKAK